MINEQRSRGVAVRSIKRPLVLVLVTAAVFAALAAAERDGSGSFDGSDIVSRQEARERFTSLFGTSAAQTASPTQLQSAGGGVAPAQAPLVAGVTTPQAALNAGQDVTARALEQVTGVSTSAVAAQQFPPFISDVVCPILLRARAQVTTTIDALIAAFPFLAPQLNAIEAAALARIDAQIAQFGCAPSP